MPSSFWLGRHLVMVLFDVDAHLAHHAQHFGAQIAQRIDRRHREIAALDRRAVADIAAFEAARGVVRTLLLVDRIEGAVHRDFEAHVVEHEEFELWAEHRPVADAGLGEIGLGALCGRARVAGVGLARGRLKHVAEHDQRGLRGKGIEDGGVRVRHEAHVGLGDVLPAGDGRAVEHDAGGDQVLIDRLHRLRRVLPLAARVGEAEIDVFDVVLLDEIENFGCVGHGWIPGTMGC